VSVARTAAQMVSVVVVRLAAAVAEPPVFGAVAESSVGVVGSSSPAGSGPAAEGRQAGSRWSVGRGGETGRVFRESRCPGYVQAEDEERDPRGGERERPDPEEPRRYGDKKRHTSEEVGVFSSRRRRREEGPGERVGERLRGVRRRSRGSESRRVWNERSWSCGCTSGFRAGGTRPPRVEDSGT
jgi:hypothetical protein